MDEPCRSAGTVIYTGAMWRPVKRCSPLFFPAPLPLLLLLISNLHPSRWSSLARSTSSDRSRVLSTCSHQPRPRSVDIVTMWLPTWLRWYKKPTYRDIKEYSTAVTSGQRSLSPDGRNKGLIPPHLSLERVLQNKTCKHDTIIMSLLPRKLTRRRQSHELV